MTRHVLDDRDSITGRGYNGIFSLRHLVQTGSGAGFTPRIKRLGREANNHLHLQLRVKVRGA